MLVGTRQLNGLLEIIYISNILYIQLINNVNLVYFCNEYSISG